MKCLFIAIMCVSFTFLAVDDDKPPAVKPGESAPSTEKVGEPKHDDRGHEGVWKPIAAVLGGVKLPEPAVNAITLNVAGESYEVSVEGAKESDKGTYILDTTTSPNRMAIKSTQGPNRGKIILAIYEMKDAVSMRVCYDLSGNAFPTEFKAPKGTQLYLAGYRRQKEQPSEKATDKTPPQ